MVKDLPASAGDGRDVGLIPGSERSPGEGSGNPLQYSCLENSMDRGAGQTAIHGVTKESDTTATKQQQCASLTPLSGIHLPVDLVSPFHDAE